MPHTRLLDYFNARRNTPLTDRERRLLVDVFKPVQIPKHVYFSQPGEVCREAAFVTSGTLKQYMLDERGKEHVIGLYMEDWWVGDRESFTNGTPTPYFIQTLEDCSLLTDSKQDVQDRLQGEAFVIELMNELTVRNAFQLLKRVHASQALTAEERYEWFATNHPEHLQRFPLQLIASYLGMTKETLSRIRR